MITTNDSIFVKLLKAHTNIDEYFITIYLRQYFINIIIV